MRGGGDRGVWRQLLTSHIMWRPVSGVNREATIASPRELLYRPLLAKNKRNGGYRTDSAWTPLAHGDWLIPSRMIRHYCDTGLLYSGTTCSLLRSMPLGLTVHNIWSYCLLRILLTLHRARTNHGNCRDLLNKRGWTESSTCDCGAAQQTVKNTFFDWPIRCYRGLKNDF